MEIISFRRAKTGRSRRAFRNPRQSFGRCLEGRSRVASSYRPWIRDGYGWLHHWDLNLHKQCRRGALELFAGATVGRGMKILGWLLILSAASWGQAPRPPLPEGIQAKRDVAYVSGGT